METINIFFEIIKQFLINANWWQTFLLIGIVGFLLSVLWLVSGLILLWLLENIRKELRK